MTGHSTGTGSVSWTTQSAEQTRAIAAALGALLHDGDVITLVGNLGAGKTQFSQGIGRGLGLQVDIPSPTFNLVFAYDQGRIPLYHFDVYRLGEAAELDDIDFSALVDEWTPGAALIEWADKFPHDMPEDRLEVTLAYGPKGGEGEPTDGAERLIQAEAHGARAAELLEAWRASVDAA